MRRPLTLGTLAVIALAGCGGGGGDGDGGARSVTVAPGKPIPVTAKEYRFEPRSIVVNAGSRGSTVLRFDLRNDGATAHDLHVVRGGQDLGGTPIFGPGQTQSGKVSVTPGSYEIVCTVGDHAALGMRGELVVK